MIKGVIFDFDGTLADSLGAGMGAYEFALSGAGAGVRTDDEIKQYFGMGADRIFQRLISDPTRARKAFELYKEYQAGQAHLLKMHEGMMEVLDELREMKIPLSIVTGRHSEDLDIAISKKSIRDRFVTVICDDHLASSKPHPEGILLALSQMKLNAHETIYVGDSLGDMKAAKAAGSVAVAALWDRFASREQFASCLPDFWAESPSQILDIVKSGR